MKNWFYFGCLVAAFALWTGCKTAKGPGVTFNDLTGEWNVIEMNGKSLNPAETHQTVRLDMAQRTLSGNAGCNRMMGKMEYNDYQPHILKFVQIATTRMACPDMSGEQELLDTLNKVVRFEAEGEGRPVERVALYGIDNTKLLVLQRQE